MEVGWHGCRTLPSPILYILVRLFELRTRDLDMSPTLVEEMSQSGYPKFGDRIRAIPGANRTGDSFERAVPLQPLQCNGFTEL